MKKIRFFLVLMVLLLVPMACALPSAVSTSAPAPTNAPADNPTSAPQPTNPPAEKPTTAPAQDDGNVIYSDDFSDSNTGWEIGDYDGGSVGYGNGYYYVRSTATSLMWGVGTENFDDMVIDVDATQIQAPSNDNNAYGLYCRRQGSTDASDAYVFLISGDGYYTIQKVSGGEFTAMVDWTGSSAINQGNSTNHLTVTCAGSNLALSINGEQVESLSDDTFVSGAIAFAAVTLEEDTVTEVHFTNLVVSQP